MPTAQPAPPFPAPPPRSWRPHRPASGTGRSGSATPQPAPPTPGGSSRSRTAEPPPDRSQSPTADSLDRNRTAPPLRVGARYGSAGQSPAGRSEGGPSRPDTRVDLRTLG